MSELILGDRRLLLFLNGLGNSTIDPFWLVVTNSIYWLPLFLIFLYLVYRKFTLKKLLLVLLILGIAIVASDQLANLFKYGIARLRPCHDSELLSEMRFVVCGGQFGFYSAHASTSFLIATYLTRMIGKDYRFLKYLAFGWALLFAYSRIYLGVHFPGDVLIGALVGFLLGGLFSTIAQRTVQKKTVI